MGNTSRGYPLAEGGFRNFPPDDINALGRAVNDDVAEVVRVLAAADAQLGRDVDAARGLNIRSGSASSAVTVTRSSSPVPGCDFLVPAGVGVLVFLGGDVSCNVWNGACTLGLRINEVRLSDSASRIIGADVPWKAGLAGARDPVPGFRPVGPESYGRRLQLHVTKDTTNAEYVIETSTIFAGLLYRTGSVG